jgi:hypothetical protein
MCLYNYKFWNQADWKTITMKAIIKQVESTNSNNRKKKNL